MSKLEELRNMISGLFTEATDKKTIDAVAKLNSAVEAVQQEQDAITARDADILKSYKDLVQHTSIKVDGSTRQGNAQVDSDIGDGERTLDLDALISEDALTQFLNNNK